MIAFCLRAAPVDAPAAASSMVIKLHTQVQSDGRGFIAVLRMGLWPGSGRCAFGLRRPAPTMSYDVGRVARMVPHGTLELYTSGKRDLFALKKRCIHCTCSSQATNIGVDTAFDFRVAQTE